MIFIPVFIFKIEILRRLLTTVGKELEQDAALRMQHLMCNLRDAFINPSINTHIRKTLLEVIELRASKWQLDLPQTLYYFPYTRPWVELVCTNCSAVLEAFCLIHIEILYRCQHSTSFLSFSFDSSMFWFFKLIQEWIFMQ